VRRSAIAHSWEGGGKPELPVKFIHCVRDVTFGEVTIGAVKPVGGVDFPLIDFILKLVVGDLLEIQLGFGHELDDRKTLTKAWDLFAQSIELGV
jgi:hypothetical protein